jgi:hypothetical protein
MASRSTSRAKAPCGCPCESPVPGDRAVTRCLRLATLLVAVLGVGTGWTEPHAVAQIPPTDRPAAPVAAAPEPAAEAKPADGDQQARHERFRKLLTGVRLVGRFTIDPPPGAGAGGEREPAREEEYVISAVTKLGDGDWWTVLARIRYGTVDLTLPVPVEVKWAGETPVITLDKVTVPGLGTFSSRVVLDGSRYAGTWQHDAVGGHMFGRILPVPPPSGDGAGGSAKPEP